MLAACSSGKRPFVMSQIELAGTPWDSPPPYPPPPPPARCSFTLTSLHSPGPARQTSVSAEGCKQRVKFSEIARAFQIIDREGVVVPQESGMEMKYAKKSHVNM